MKVIVQSKKTQLYLGPKGKWVKERAQAMEFKGSTEALEYCLEHHIPKVSIVLDFGNKEFDVKLDMGEN